jgi:4,5-dihydroxyphthalate decarboxylase
MAKLRLTFGCWNYDRTRALLDGTVVPDGIDLNYLAIDHPREIFDRMQNHQEFDASEMSSSDYARHVAHDGCPFVALPVFVSRVFRHGHIAINRKLEADAARGSKAGQSAALLF